MDLFKNYRPSLVDGFGGGRGSLGTPADFFGSSPKIGRTMTNGLITHGNRHWQLGENKDHPRNPLDLSKLLKISS